MTDFVALTDWAWLLGLLGLGVAGPGLGVSVASCMSASPTRWRASSNRSWASPQEAMVTATSVNNIIGISFLTRPSNSISASLRFGVSSNVSA